MRSRLSAWFVVFVLAGCGAATPSSSGPTVSPGSEAASASAPASGAPSTPEPSVSPPAPSPTAIAARWEQIGSATGGDVVGFGAGYVALGGPSDIESSVDGRAWSPARLPFKASKDPNGIRLAAQAAAVATDGHEVVVVGGYTHGPCRPAGGAVGGGPECPSSPISWVTSDGRTWTSSFPWHGPDAPKGFWQGSSFSTVWAVPTGGFDAAVMNVAGEAGEAGDIFHSDDGLAWTPLPATPPKKLAGAPNPTELWDVGLADATGRRLVASYWYLAGGDSVARLFSSPDGGSWTSLDGFPGQGVQVGSAVAPDPALASVWIVAGQDASSYPAVWTSPDLATWTAHRLPTASPAAQGRITDVVATSLGYVALAQLADGPDGTAYHASWLSANGSDWTPIAPVGGADGAGPDVLADGPNGIVGFALYDGSDVPPGVWTLK